ncbi:hypothetical protein [Labilibaculum sp.]|uniref:hypothetical protein n=1 Tax=Labilibaculum sp. TaxID=2060723 RepID=UPI003565CBA4
MVTINAETEATFVLISVCDNGVGIASETLDHFESKSINRRNGRRKRNRIRFDFMQGIY